MHDKVLIVDGALAITGGRNMADEYFDYDHEYNFRDRDALVLGAVVASMSASFERFWASELAVPVERLLGESPSSADQADAKRVYAELAAYAPLVTPGSYIVATDGIMEDLEDVPRGRPGWSHDNPAAAARAFAAAHPEFALEPPPFVFDEVEAHVQATYWPAAYLRRRDGAA